MGLLIFYLLLALAISFLCSIMEAVILSTTITFVEEKENSGNKTAKLLRRQKENIDRPLSAILSINTVAHTIGAAGVGAQAVAVFGEAYFGLISAILTLLILFFSEIIPKTVGANYWRGLSMISARIIQVMIWISYPLVWISELLAKLISKKSGNTVSRQEVAAMAKIGETEGVLEESESTIISNLLKLRKIKVKEVMTPRTVMVSASEDMKLVDFFNDRSFMSFSRIPIYNGELENIMGYILKYDALEKIAKDEFDMKLKDLKRPVLMTSENQPLPALFSELLKKKEHLSVVIDEFGDVAGIITMEDIIETIIGVEIIDETDSEIDLQELAKEKWKVRAKKMNIDHLINVDKKVNKSKE
jgi:CBS domain containing-hemolysin-like protein